MNVENEKKFSLSLTLPLTLTLTLPLSLSLSHTHTHSLSLSHALTHLITPSSHESLPSSYLSRYLLVNLLQVSYLLNQDQPLNGVF